MSDDAKPTSARVTGTAILSVDGVPVEIAGLADKPLFVDEDPGLATLPVVGPGGEVLGEVPVADPGVPNEILVTPTARGAEVRIGGSVIEIEILVPILDPAEADLDTYYDRVREAYLSKHGPAGLLAVVWGARAAHEGASGVVPVGIVGDEAWAWARGYAIGCRLLGRSVEATTPRASRP